MYAGTIIYEGEDRQFLFIVIASVLIAAAGYIINDYFDLNIDQVNKPDKVVVNLIINRRWDFSLPGLPSPYQHTGTWY